MTHSCREKSATSAKYSLRQTGIDNEALYTLASRTTDGIFYMDDFAKSVATEEAASELYQQLV